MSKLANTVLIPLRLVCRKMFRAMAVLPLPGAPIRPTFEPTVIGIVSSRNLYPVVMVFFSMFLIKSSNGPLTFINVLGLTLPLSTSLVRKQPSSPWFFEQ